MSGRTASERSVTALSSQPDDPRGEVDQSPGAPNEWLSLGRVDQSGAVLNVALCSDQFAQCPIRRACLWSLSEGSADFPRRRGVVLPPARGCLLYTSDAAD